MMIMSFVLMQISYWFLVSFLVLRMCWQNVSLVVRMIVVVDISDVVRNVWLF